MTSGRRFVGVRTLALLTISTVMATSALAEWRLPSVISDNMVLQANRPVTLWGWADPGEKITVKYAGQSKTSTANAKGKWMVKLAALPASDKAQVLLIQGSAQDHQSKIQNVIVGEVWLASGQSNMAWTVNRCNRFEEEAKAATYPGIRMFTAARVTAATPQNEVNGAWVVCSPSTVAGFSATAYFFGRELHKTLKTPVGILHSSWGGTPVEAWTSTDAQQGKPGFQPMLEAWSQKVKAYDPAKAKQAYNKALATWEQRAKAAKAAKIKPPRRPSLAGNPSRSSHHPAALFNGMIAPLVPYSLRGAIWYQGESNANPTTAAHYGSMLTTMIQDWRTRFGQGDFQFLFVQLANFNRNELWVVVQDEMRKALRFPNTGMAVINDIGNATDIHPKNKQDVGRRLAFWALSTTYGKDIVGSGPLFAGAEVKGNAITVRFEHVGGGLLAKGGGPLKGFEIAGADGKYVPASATIQGETVVVSSAAVPAPKTVRYAWASNPTCNLYNKAGLPASVFSSKE